MSDMGPGSTEQEQTVPGPDSTGHQWFDLVDQGPSQPSTNSLARRLLVVTTVYTGKGNGWQDSPWKVPGFGSHSLHGSHLPSASEVWEMQLLPDSRREVGEGCWCISQSWWQRGLPGRWQVLLGQSSQRWSQRDVDTASGCRDRRTVATVLQLIPSDSKNIASRHHQCYRTDSKTNTVRKPSQG